MKRFLRKWLGIDILASNQDVNISIEYCRSRMDELDKIINQKTTTKFGENLTNTIERLLMDNHAIKEFLDIEIKEESREETMYSEINKRFYLYPVATKRTKK